MVAKAKEKLKSTAGTQATTGICEDDGKLLCKIKEITKLCKCVLGNKIRYCKRLEKTFPCPLALRRDRKEYDINLGGDYAGFKEHSIQYSNDGYDFELSLKIDEAGDVSDDTELYVSKNDKLLATPECQSETMKYGNKTDNI